MASDFLKKITRRRWIWLVILTLMVPAYVLVRALFSQGTAIPYEFIESKEKSASIAAVIVDMSKQAAGELDRINSLEKRGDYYGALNLINSELKRVSEMRLKASELLEKLTEMTKALPEIEPQAAREKGLEAINYEINLINHLISYNNGLETLLKLLNSEFIYGENIGQEFGLSIGKINDEAKAIKELNDKFNQAIEAMGGFN